MTTPIPADLRASFDRYRSRIIGLNRKIFFKMLDDLSIPPDSTDPGHLKLIEETEWRLGAGGSPYWSLPSSVKTPHDIIPLLSDGTPPPLPEGARSELLIQIEAALNAQAAPEFRPVRLPDEFKQLCALTESITGPGLPRVHNEQIPECFSGLRYGLFTLQGGGLFEALTVEGLMSAAHILEGWEVGAGMGIGAYEHRGGTWLCWCRSDVEVEGDEQAHIWKWRWILLNDIDSLWYEDVKEMLDESWDQHLTGIESVYGEIDVSDLQSIALDEF
ncbi:hypothetical protein MBLNU459_g5530t1 [Dothideomycetes sp. NU459]